ncbi:hypothetical protein [Aeromonas taiwanensis]|uniref:hypothetical protein n=1 Tax=Aeromonas taiwanensis TaxID=633417 RepID=UPI003BA3449C
MVLADTQLTLAGLITVGLILCKRALGQPDWEALPTLPKYLVCHPDCVTGDAENASCHACGSDKVEFHPLTSVGDYRLRHTCLACGTALFRTEEPR